MSEGEQYYSKSLTKIHKSYPFLEWDGFNDGNYLSYHYSPKYQIGFSYFYQIEHSRWLIGAQLAWSLGAFRGIKRNGVKSSTSVETSATVSMDDGSGNTQAYLCETYSYSGTHDKYSEEIDPYNEAKKYDANFLVLANIGFNVCNGFMIELGAGAARHRDKYHMPYNYSYTKTTYTNLSTGETSEPKYEYYRNEGDEWFAQNKKWSSAFRIGTRFTIPLDGRYGYYFLTVGGGYTYLFSNKDCSSWDVNGGLLWKF